MTAPPLVSIVMSVKDGAPYLEEAVRAVLAQTLSDFELIVIDDGSTDETPDILAGLATEDARIRILTMEKNLGLAGACNKGIEAARGQFVARMDADDVARPDWLETVHRKLESDPSLVFVGSGMRHMTQDGTFISNRYLDHSAAEMRWAMMFHTVVAHPTTIFHRRFVTGPDAIRYDASFRLAEDFDFFSRLLGKGDGMNTPEPLVSYRIHPTSVSQSRWRDQLGEARSVAFRQQSKELPDDVFSKLDGFRRAFYGQEPTSAKNILTGLLSAAHSNGNGCRKNWLAEEVVRLYSIAMRRGGQTRRAIVMGLVTNAPIIAGRAALGRFRRQR